jgi:uncharacterized damage-inducible protein DinB
MQRRLQHRIDIHQQVIWLKRPREREICNMTKLEETVAAGFSTHYEKHAAALRELAAPLSEQQFWAKPFAFGNSFGHLVLHLIGNLNYYIGAQIAGTGYVRDRPLEFSNASPPSKAEVLNRLDEAIAMVIRTIRSQSAEDWSREYSGTGVDARNRFEMVMQCDSHLQHHVGQMMYLSFEFKKKS